MTIGRLAARVLVGGLFVGHGSQKLFGAFGGPGIDGTEAMMNSLELRPARRNAVLAGATEAGGGALLGLGLLTPAAAAAIIGAMTTAIRKVHLPNGLWSANGGYEYNLALIAALVAITEDGPGPVSLDHLLGIERKGPRWALAALATGVAASAVAIELGRRAGPATTRPTAPAAPEASASAGTSGERSTSDDGPGWTGHA
jgi:putative oxidoreductase